MCRELELIGCKVKVAVTGNDPDNILERECIRVYEIKIKVLRLLSYWIYGYAKFIYNFIKLKPDLVILDIYSIWFSIPFVFLRRRKTVFIIDDRTPRYSRASNKSSLRGRVVRMYTKLSYKFCKQFLNGMTVITDYYKEFVHKNFDFPYSMMDVWGSGVDLNKFFPQKNSELERPPFLKDKFVVMQHGEFSNNRGILETIEAISLMKREDVFLMFIGDGMMKNEMLQKIERLGIENRVKLIPPVSHSEIPKYIGYSDCAIMAYPDIEYWNNNNPIKLLEYLAVGKVVICTDMWTFRTVGGNRRCVYYIKDNSPNKIATAIESLYENKDLLSAWADEGVGAVREKYTWHSHAKTILDFHRRLKGN